MEELKDEADVTASEQGAGLFAEPLQRRSGDLDGSDVGHDQTGDQVQQGALA